MRASVRTAALTVAAMLLTACTWSAEEPGLFREGPVEDSPSRPQLPPLPTNPDLPVAGEAVWTSSEGLGVTSRFAVHAVRRIDGASVLDISVTPLAAEGFARGDVLPTWVDLGLTRETGGDVNALLLDAPAGVVYRPVSHKERNQFNRCLCSPLWVAQLGLRIGETRMLQVTFPELPEAVRAVDVSLITLPMFVGVPVSPLGQVRSATSATDLTRPAPSTAAISRPVTFDLDGLSVKRQQSVQIESISASRHLTSMRWTIHSITDQPGVHVLPAGPPISAELPADVNVLNPGSAYGPQLSLGGGTEPLKALFMTVRLQRGMEFFECLCTDLGRWATSLREAGGSATVTTNFPALASGVDTVDVVLPGAGMLARLPVTAALDSAARLGPDVPADTETWVYDATRPPSGWSTQDWPTPVPDPGQLRDYEAVIEQLRRPPGW